MHHMCVYSQLVNTHISHRASNWGVSSGWLYWCATTHKYFFRDLWTGGLKKTTLKLDEHEWDSSASVYANVRACVHACARVWSCQPVHQSVGKETHRNVQLSSLRPFNEHPRLYFCASAVSGTSGPPPCWNLQAHTKMCWWPETSLKTEPTSRWRFTILLPWLWKRCYDADFNHLFKQNRWKK